MFTHPLAFLSAIRSFRHAGILLAGLLSLCSCHPQQVQEEPGLIPRPLSCEPGKGWFRLSENTRIYYSPDSEEMRKEASYLAELIGVPTGYNLKVEPYSQSAPQTGNILLELAPSGATDSSLESYTLEVGRKGVRISGAGSAGVFYGIQSLRQLLPPEIEGRERSFAQGKAWKVPCLVIHDHPRFGWRGMMLDVSRHFFDREFVMDFIDFLAMYKMNTFHWHLVDDQGWRIEIKAYPKLTRVGAWRVDHEDLPWNERPAQQQGDSASYGGYYTQEDIREIVRYAADRHITIVPEIEMPAHVSSAIAAYPELSCSGKKITVPPGGVWPITDIYCAGKEETFEFLENVLTEVMELFPGPYIHIGGDEATKTNWETCRYCQERIRKEGLKNTKELQSYFIRRIEKFLNAHGKKLVGWDEIMEGGLAPEATVMSWRGTSGGIEAARAGHPLVMSPTSHCYFDYYQGDPASEPPAIGGYLPLSKVYSFDPVPAELTESEASLILGAQANLWTEYISTPSHAEYMIFPRITAMAEVGWTLPGRKDWEHFKERVSQQQERWDAAGIHYARSAWEPPAPEEGNPREE